LFFSLELIVSVPYNEKPMHNYRENMIDTYAKT